MKQVFNFFEFSAIESSTYNTGHKNDTLKDHNGLLSFHKI